MSVLLTAGYLLLGGSAAQAKVGETKEQIMARFGRPVAGAEDHSIYRKGGFMITVFYQDSVCVGEMIYKAPVIDRSAPVSPVPRWQPGGALSENEVTTLLDLCGEGKGWTHSPLEGSWTRADGYLLALHREAAMKDTPRPSTTDIEMLMYTPCLEFVNAAYYRAALAQQAALKKQTEQQDLTAVFGPSPAR